MQFLALLDKGSETKVKIILASETTVTSIVYPPKNTSKEAEFYTGEGPLRVAKLQAQLATAGKPGGFAMLGSDGRLPQDLLVAGYEKHSAYDLGWQSLHMAATAACR
ncbi:unnamed protein product [Porites evermanni]|uniref:Uncharacterized protein n=1 Tax=Porites evermanni TaxID=104178 RepID=A0ABN8M4V5_9CNID|nr:unnamed protein product [Porites evermanni]